MSWLDRRAKFAKVLLAPLLMLVVLMPLAVRASADPNDQKDDDDDRDHVILSFSTVGDSRQDPVAPDVSTPPPSCIGPSTPCTGAALQGQDKIWLENTKAWARIMRSIQEQQSNFLFFNGDMIMGYGKANVPANNSTVAGIVGSDLMKFYRQYGFWRGIVSTMMETGTYVVPVPGNHETQCKACGKTAQVENENAWRANMGDLIFDNPRFQTLFGTVPSYEFSGNGGLDSLPTDQSQLSYSFDFGNSHFAVINTDPVGADAHAPSNWLAKDLGDAVARGQKHLFVFGHKPAYTYYYGTNLPVAPSGLDNFIPARDAFWDVIEQYGATYFCGHEHIFNLSQPRAATGGKAWQVLVGSGGSPFEDADPATPTVNPSTDRDYAWATVKIYQSGLVKITAYGFDDHFGKTTTIGSLKLWQ